MTILAALDILVAALLVATIAYCVMLNRRLGALRRNEEELRKVLSTFGDAATRAEAGIANLRKAGGEVGDVLGHKVAEARAIYDELAFVTERGDSLVSQIADSLTAVRPVLREAAPSASPEPASAPRAA
ncbi:MAG: DUF6468 domain-containing protein, partial [Alphaproteobacteria bacterium]